MWGGGGGGGGMGRGEGDYELKTNKQKGGGGGGGGRLFLYCQSVLFYPGRADRDNSCYLKTDSPAAVRL